MCSRILPFLLQIICSRKLLGEIPSSRHLNARKNLFFPEIPTYVEHSVRSCDDGRILQGPYFVATANSLVNGVTLGDVDPKFPFRVHFINQQGIHQDGNLSKLHLLLHQ